MSIFLIVMSVNRANLFLDGFVGIVEVNEKNLGMILEIDFPAQIYVNVYLQCISIIDRFPRPFASSSVGRFLGHRSSIRSTSISRLTCFNY